MTFQRLWYKKNHHIQLCTTTNPTFSVPFFSQFCNMTAPKTYILSYIYINYSETYKRSRSGRLWELSLRTMYNVSESDLSRILSETWLLLVESKCCWEGYYKGERHQIKFCLSKFLPPATKLRQGNVFTPVCHSVHGGMRASMPPPPGTHSRGSHPPWACRFPPPPDTMRYGQWAGGTHPTGMHTFDSKDQVRKSCFCTQNSAHSVISWRHLCRKICCQDDGCFMVASKQTTGMLIFILIDKFPRSTEFTFTMSTCIL